MWVLCYICASLSIGYIIVYGLSCPKQDGASIFAEYAKRERDMEHFILTTDPAFFPLPLVSSLLRFVDPKNRDVSMQHEIKRHWVELTIQGANLL